MSRRRRNRGLTLLEVIVFLLVVGTGLSALLMLFMQTTRAAADPLVRKQALAIATSVMEEIQLRAFTYCDPGDANVHDATSTAGYTTPEGLGPEGENRYVDPRFDNVSDYNGFGMGALRCADGAFVLGEMAGHTANAGRIYFPSGTPDPGDVSEGRLDMAGSVERETAEETGLTPADYHPGAHWDCVVTGPAIAMIRTLHLELSGEAARERIEACLSRQVDPELSAIHLVRSRSDFNDNMPRFVTAFIESQLEG